MNKPTLKISNLGTRYWILPDNEFHREDGPAVEFGSGGREWWLYGNLHRKDGPAVEEEGYRAWYIHGEMHREDGPAREWSDGRKEWYWHGKKIDCQTQEEFERWKRLKAFW